MKNEKNSPCNLAIQLLAAWRRGSSHDTGISVVFTKKRKRIFAFSYLQMHFLETTLCFWNKTENRNAPTPLRGLILIAEAAPMEGALFHWTCILRHLSVHWNHRLSLFSVTT